MQVWTCMAMKNLRWFKMKKIILIAIASLALFSGCANKMEVKCPSCDIKYIDGVKTIDCKECTVEAKAVEDFSFINLPNRD